MDQMKVVNRVTRIVNTLLRRPEAAYPRRVAITLPNDETIDFLSGTSCRVIAELGIYKGHTSMRIAKWLDGQGELHLFDYEDRVRKVADEIEKAGFRNIRRFGASYKLLDSYCWPLAKLLDEHREPIYDYVFIDGAHTWTIDGFATLLCDRLLKIGGYLDFDDHDWTLAGSPALKPSELPLTAELYTEEQIAAKQVKMIIDLLIRRDSRYKEIVENKIFQKIA